MKKTLLMLFVCFVITNNFWFITEGRSNQNNSIDDTILESEHLNSTNYLAVNNNHLNAEDNIINEIDYNIYENNVSSTKRNYSYLYYTNTDNDRIKNKEDIRMAIYNGLNEGKDIITLYCDYDNNDNCLNDFYTVYRNKLLMSSINNYVSPYNKYTSTKYRININNDNVKIEITINKKYTEDQAKEINKKIDDYINEFDLSNMSDTKKIKWAHDFIIDRNKYDEDAAESGIGDAYSAYGAIVGSNAICQGYAEAIALILDKFDIPNILVSNNVHIWNLVNIDGKWLHLDATWDDPITSSGNQIRRYKYYLVTSDELSNLDSSNNHEFNTSYYLETLI